MEEFIAQTRSFFEDIKDGKVLPFQVLELLQHRIEQGIVPDEMKIEEMEGLLKRGSENLAIFCLEKLREGAPRHHIEMLQILRMAAKKAGLSLWVMGTSEEELMELIKRACLEEAKRQLGIIREENFFEGGLDRRALSHICSFFQNMRMGGFCQSDICVTPEEWEKLCALYGRIIGS